MAKHPKTDEIKQLRSEGRSLSEICAELEVAKSTVSGIIKGQVLTSEQQCRINQRITASRENFNRLSQSERIAISRLGGQSPKPPRPKRHISDKRSWHTRYNRSRRKLVRDRVIEIVGTRCWRCNYDQGLAGFSILDFHHLDHAFHGLGEKQFCLTAAQRTTRSWRSVANELRKCVLICCRCHREHHVGLLSAQQLEADYLREWPLIEHLMMAADLDPPC